MQTKIQRHNTYIRHRKEILKKRKIYRELHREEINRKKLEDYYKEPWKLILSNIRRRCENKKSKDYKWYGGKGIKNFLNLDDIKFLWFRDKAYLMEKPSIDREYSNKDYTLKNCRFIELKNNCGKEQRKPVIQFDLNGNFIQEYNSISEASRLIHQDISSIIDCLKLRLKQNCGSIWRYKNGN